MNLAVKLGGARGILVGRLSAHIPGDYRYSDELTVALNDDGQVVIEVSVTGAEGGMDTFNGATDPRVAHRVVLAADSTPAQVVAAVKKAMVARGEFVLARYGKPTKHFIWGYGRPWRGLSAKLAGLALAEAREELAHQRQKAALPVCVGCLEPIVNPAQGTSDLCARCAACSVCGKKIPERDVRAFQADSGPASFPDCCEDCAEGEVRP